MVGLALVLTHAMSSERIPFQEPCTPLNTSHICWADKLVNAEVSPLVQWASFALKPSKLYADESDC